MSLFAQESEYGIASYYGDEYQGGETASGERYDKNLLTAAHKSLPMGTRVRVTRMDTKKFVDVRINDEGPWVKGRIIDLSGKAAEALGIRRDGTARVKLDVLGKGGAIATKTTTKAPAKKTTKAPVVETPKGAAATSKPISTSTASKPPVVTPTKETKKETAAEVYKPQKKPSVETPKGKATKVSKKVAAEAASAEFDLVTPKNYSTYGLYKIALERPKNAAYGVQIASLSSYTNVLKQVATLQGKWFKNILMSIEEGTNKEPIYKVILGPFPDAETAKSYQKHAKKKGVNGFVVNLGEEE